MTRFAIWPVVALFLLAGIAAGCKKKREFNAESAQDSVDARMVQGENDEVVKDVNIAIMEDFLLRGRSSQTGQVAGTSLCGVVLDTSKVTSGILTLKYNGTNCFGRTRTGSVRLTLMNYPLMKWKNVGAVVKIEFLDYKMVRSSDGKSVKISGVEEMKNLSGNTWFELWYVSQPNVVYSVSGTDMNVTFDNTATAIFSFNRKLTFTFSNNVTTCRVEGLATENGKSNVENWGQTRDGSIFTSEIVEPPVWKSECGAMAPSSGEVWVKVDGKEHELKCYFGVGSDGEATSDKCPFGWRVEWSRKKRTNTRTFGYY